MKKNKRNKDSNRGRDLNRHDVLPQSEWTPVMWAVHDYARALVQRLAHLDIDVRFERDRSHWGRGFTDLQLITEANGDVVVVIGSECLVAGIGPTDRILFETSLLAAVCEYLAFLDGVPVGVIVALLKAEVQAVVEADPEWCAAQQAKLYFAV